MNLIANCDLGQSAKTDIWDYHMYSQPVINFIPILIVSTDTIRPALSSTRSIAGTRTIERLPKYLIQNMQ